MPRAAKSNLLLLAVFACFLATRPSSAQSGGLAFLKIEPNAEALGTGSALTATTNDAYATFVNPAGLGGGRLSSVALTYNAWIGDTQLFDFAGRFRIGENGGLGVALSSNTSGDIEGRAQPGPASSTSSGTFLSAGVGYGHQIGPVRIGATAKYVLEKLFEYHANGIAFDVGTQVDVIEDRVWVAGAIQNLGSMEELNTQQTDLPSTYRVGVALQPVTVQMTEDGSEPVHLYLSADILHRTDEDRTYVQLGGWVEALDFLWVRAGYLIDNEARSLTLGLGLEYESIRFDYAYLPFADGFGNAGQVVSLQYFY
jgi:hypothetical protein